MNKLDISKYSACGEAVKWYDKKESFKQAWDHCHRGDWMLWISKKLKVDEKKLFLAQVKCARTVIHLMKDKRSIEAIQAAEDYALYKISKKELAVYAEAAYATTAATGAARQKNQKLTADICRKVLTDEVFKKHQKNEQ